MSQGEPVDPSRADSEAPRGTPSKPADSTGPLSDSAAEEYRKYREAEREEEKRLERYERTKSIDTEHVRRDDQE